jgi:mono/diheme cytochrome c family protein
MVAIRSGSRWVFEVRARPRVLTRAALLAVVASTGRGEPSAPHAENGGKLYAEVCAECHGATLGGGKGPPLGGAGFLQNWQHKTARDLYSRILTTMPADAPGTLPEETVLDVTIYILSQNGINVGSAVKALPDSLSTIEIKP